MLKNKNYLLQVSQFTQHTTIYASHCRNVG